MRIFRLSHFLFFACVFLAIQFANAQNIGVYTGTFDPPHKGHIEVLSEAIEHGRLDKVYVMPGPAEHKPNASSHEVRMALTAKAFFHMPQVEFPTGEAFDLFMENRYPQALESIARQNTGATVYQIVGTDRLDSFTEKRIENSKTAFIVSAREADYRPRPSLAKFIGTKIVMLPNAIFGNSSTLVRSQLKQGIWPESLPKRLAGILLTHRPGMMAPRLRCQLATTQLTASGF